MLGQNTSSNMTTATNPWERPLRAVILVAAHRMGLRRRMRGWRRPKGAGGGGDVGVGVGGDPGGCCGGGGLDGGERGGGGGGEGDGGKGGRGGDGGNCRRPGLAWKGVLGRMSGRSCWSRASRGEPCPVESHPAPSAGSVACLGRARRRALSVIGSWRPCSPGRWLCRVLHRPCDV
jgi:hypothetical protein